MYPKTHAIVNFPKSTRQGLALVLLAVEVTLVACQKKPASDPKDHVSSSLALTAVSSPKNLIHRKRADVLNNILFKALDLPDKKAVCTELGKKKLQCADVVHRVALGSMEAYENTMYQHPEGVNLTSPIALDRLVLSACATRAGRDFGKLRNNVISDQAVIFKNVKLTTDLRLVLNDAIDQAIARLYQRGLTRDPTPSETQALRDLYQQIFDKNPVGAAVNWMTLSCFAVLTSIEGAFY